MIISKRRISKFSWNFWCKVNHLKIKGGEFGLTLNKGQFINSPLICSSILFFPLFSKERSVPVFFCFFCFFFCEIKQWRRKCSGFSKISDWSMLLENQYTGIKLCASKRLTKSFYGWSMFAALIGLNITMPVGSIGYYARIRPQLRHLRNCFFLMLLKLFSL